MQPNLLKKDNQVNWLHKAMLENIFLDLEMIHGWAGVRPAQMSNYSNMHLQQQDIDRCGLQAKNRASWATMGN
jgi:hypothetical protein